MFNNVQGIVTDFLGNSLSAIIIIIIGFILGKISEKFIKKFLQNLELDKFLSNFAKIKFSIENTISKAVSYFIYFLSIVMALGKLGLTTTVLHIISAAVMLFIVVALILSLKDFIPNLIASFLIYKNKLVRVNDTIQINGVEGKVILISLVETQIKTNKNDIIHIPNSSLVKDKFLVKN